MNDSLRILTQKIPKLPTIPPVADKIIQLVSSKAAVVGSIVDTIERDPAISAKVISFANAAFYRMGQPVTTIQDAVMKIGFDNVKSIALGISLLTLFKGKQGADNGEYRNIIRHSVAVGVIAKEVADLVDWRDHEDVFTSGLLHDIGLMVMHTFFPEICAQVIDRFKKGMPFHQAEREICGFSHGEVGAWLADKWNLPDSFYDVIRNHHTPSSAIKNTSLTAIVHLADITAIKKGFSPTDIEGFEGPLDSAAVLTLGMNEERLSKLESRVAEVSVLIDDLWR